MPEIRLRSGLRHEPHPRSRPFEPQSRGGHLLAMGPCRHIFWPRTATADSIFRIPLIIIIIIIIIIILITSDLSLDQHIDAVCAKCFFQLRQNKNGMDSDRYEISS